VALRRHGHNLIDTVLRLAAECCEVRVVDDQVGRPTFTRHLAEALITIAERGHTGRLDVTGGGRCSWFEFARIVLVEDCVEASVVPCSMLESPRPAQRPACSVLLSTRADAPMLPPWREGVREYLATAWS
jgi:dTDP-4-dehydrorhamnose reductase